jgi:hypothetical protein
MFQGISNLNFISTKPLSGNKIGKKREYSGSINLNPPLKFPNQGVLAFPGVPCEPNFRGPKIGETGSQWRGPPEG